MLAAFLTQFPRGAFTARFQNFIQTRQTSTPRSTSSAKRPGWSLHADMSAQLKDAITSRCRELKLPVCDLTGPFVEFLSRESGMKPDANYRRLHDVDETYRRRIRALEFTLPQSAAPPGAGKRSSDNPSSIRDAVACAL